MVRALVFGVGLLVLATAGCGSTSTERDSMATTVGTTSTTALLTKSELIDRVDVLCTEVGDELDDVTPTDWTDPDQVRTYLDAWIVTNRAAVEEAEALGPPATDAEAWDAVIAEMYALLDIAARDRDELVDLFAAVDSSALADSDFGRASARLADQTADFGFQVCGQPGGGTSTTTAGGWGDDDTVPSTRSTAGAGARTIDDLAAAIGCTDVEPVETDVPGAVVGRCSASGVALWLMTFADGRVPTSMDAADLCPADASLTMATGTGWLVGTTDPSGLEMIMAATDLPDAAGGISIVAC